MSEPKPEPKPDIEALFRDGKEIYRVLREAVKDALRVHKLLGQSIVVWKDGKVVIVPPEEISIDDDDESPPAE
jgi:hypothetical protein